MTPFDPALSAEPFTRQSITSQSIRPSRADPLAVEAKREFFDQLGELLRNPRVWALFVLREDYLVALDPYALQVPTHLENRYRIDFLGLAAARSAGAPSWSASARRQPQPSWPPGPPPRPGSPGW